MDDNDADASSPGFSTVSADDPVSDTTEPDADASRSQPNEGDEVDGSDPDESGSTPDDTESGDTESGDVPSDEAESAQDAAEQSAFEQAASEQATAEESATEESAAEESATEEPPTDVQKYARFKKVDGAQYDRVNDFLRDRTYITAREWAIARLCADFRTETGVEMTKIGENLPELVPFMTDTYTPQAVNQARSSFEGKIRKSGATFLYGAMSGFFTAEELEELMYEVSEIAKFLLEVEGVDLSVEEELEAEERISSVMREVREASADLRAEELTGQGESDAGGDAADDE